MTASERAKLQACLQVCERMSSERFQRNRDTDGIIFICPTPIGNLEDITLRVLRTLREVDLIAAENTAHTQKLLHHYEIKKPLISYYDLGQSQVKEKIILEKLKSGSSVALVSSAGTPLVSDPGFKLIRQCIQENIPVVSLPGPSALITALVVSGISPHPFFFGGFIPSKPQARKSLFQELAKLPYTLVLYEAPHRILQSIQDALQTFGNRHAALVRELTKVHEEIFRGKLSDLFDKIRSLTLKGEITLMISGYESSDEFNEENFQEEIKALLQKGVSVSQTSKILAKKHGISKNKIYALAHRLSS